MKPITVPPLADIQQRIKACREVMNQLKRLQRLVLASSKADSARDVRRDPVPVLRDAIAEMNNIGNLEDPDLTDDFKGHIRIWAVKLQAIVDELEGKA
jgi:hypothetical protein